MRRVDPDAEAARLAEARKHPDESAQAALELERINGILRAYGFDYPLGARGVQDLADGYLVRQEELRKLDPEHWAPARRRPDAGYLP